MTTARATTAVTTAEGKHRVININDACANEHSEITNLNPVKNFDDPFDPICIDRLFHKENALFGKHSWAPCKCIISISVYNVVSSTDQARFHNYHPSLKKDSYEYLRIKM